MAYIHSVQIDSGGLPYLIEPQLYANATGTSTALVAGITNFTLFSGAYVHVKVGTVAAGAKLNVNGTGAKNIYYNGAPIVDNFLTEGNIYTFIYTGTNWELVGDITNKNILIGTTQEWIDSAPYQPPAGTVLIVTDYSTYTSGNTQIAVPGIKISDGSTPVIDLPCVGDDIRASVTTHINNTDIHVTAADKTSWNNKITCENTVSNNNLILTRD